MNNVNKVVIFVTLNNWKRTSLNFLKLKLIEDFKFRKKRLSSTQQFYIYIWYCD